MIDIMIYLFIVVVVDRTITLITFANFDCGRNSKKKKGILDINVTYTKILFIYYADQEFIQNLNGCNLNLRKKKKTLLQVTDLKIRGTLLS